MDLDTTSKNERAEKLLGRRFSKEQEGHVTPFDCPCELGYWCPSCRKAWDESLQWSEYASMLWCPACNFDWPSAMCVRINDVPDPERSWENVGRDAAVRVFLDSVKHAIERVAPKATEPAEETPRRWLGQPD